MGLFGNLFSESTDKEKTTIINDKTIQKEMKVLNDTLNEMTMSIVQETLKQTAAGADIKQEILITNLKAAGDIIVGPVSQKADVEISVSSLTDSEMKQDLVQSTMNELQAKLEDTMKLSQKDIEEKGEQFGSLLADSFNNLVNTVAGGSTDKETSIEDRLNITDSTEISNSVKNAVNTDLVNSTIESISSNIVGDQEAEVSNLESTGGSVIVAGVEQELLSKQILESITKVGTGSKIISELTGFTEAEVEGMIEAEDENILKEQGTISAAGGFLESAGSAWSGVITSMGSMVIIPVLIVGGLLLFVFRKSVSKIAEKQAGVEPQFQQQQFPQQQYYQGGGGIKKGIKSIKSMLKTITKSLTKYYKKYATKKNLILLVIVVLASLVIYKLYKIYSKTEKFTNESKMENVMISNKGKYLKNKKLGDNHLCLNEDKSKAFKFNVTKNKDETITIHKAGKGKKLYMKLQDNDIILAEFNSAHSKKYNFTFEKAGENTYTFSQGKKHLALKNGCLTVIPKKEDASKLKFE